MRPSPAAIASIDLVTDALPSTAAPAAIEPLRTRPEAQDDSRPPQLWTIGTFDDEEDGDAPPTASRPLELRSWEDAVARLDRYPWAQRHPLAVHPEFRAQRELMTQIGVWAREVNDRLHATAGGRTVPE